MSFLLKPVVNYWASEDATPTSIIKFPDDITGTPEFYIDKIASILEKGGALRCPVFIISITGVLRSGKSFLLNLMKIYLEYYAKNKTDAGWESNGDVKISGGAWARATNSVTHGIWMWDHPFILNGIAILLVDSQGTGDTKMGDATLDNLIVYLGLHMSHVQILNLNKNLLSNDLERLELCAGYAQAVGDVDSEESSAVFDSLIFLVRDWEANDDFGEKKDQLKEILEEAKAETVKGFAEGVSKAFTHITAFALPHPGRTVTRCSVADDKLTLGGIEKEFLPPVKQLFRKLFIQLPQRHGSKLKLGRATLNRFKALEDRTMRNGTIKISTAAQALTESLLNKAFLDASKYYDSEMGKAYETLFAGEDEIEQYVKKIADNALRKFLSHKMTKKYPNADSKGRYEQALKEKASENAIDEKFKFISSAQVLLRERKEFENLQERLQAEERKLEEETRKLQEAIETAKRKKEVQQVQERRRAQDELRVSCEQEKKKRDATSKKLEDERNRLLVQKRLLLQAAERIRNENEKNVLSEEEEWVEQLERKKMQCSIM